MHVKSKSLAGPSEICMLMPIRKRFTEGLATRTYESRLRSFTKLFGDLRAVARESRLSRPFSDIVDRLETIHGVTIAIVDGQLLLTVHFDQPWEPYIRVIWDQLGQVFDLILCNCEGYVEEHRNDLGYEAFARWIRKWQIETNTFYINSNHTVDDVIYLDQLEKKVRSGDSNLVTSGIVSPEAQAAAVRKSLAGRTYLDYIKSGVEVISAFHALTFLYPKGTDDHVYLWKAARSVLPGWEFKPQGDWRKDPDLREALQTLRTVFRTELNWFEEYDAKPRVIPDPVPGLPFDPTNVQSGIAAPYGANAGCLALLQVTDAVGARHFLNSFRQEISFGDGQAFDEIYRNIGFTTEGLARLGLPEADLEKLPPAFQEGMAARAGLIGDLRHNHPDQWLLPERNWPRRDSPPAKPRQSVNLESVDIVIQLRRKASEAVDGQAEDEILASELERIQRDSKGSLLVLSVQPMYSQGDPEKPVEHFGFRDGISNPKIDEKNPDAQDVVPTGDIFLGQPNSRSDRLSNHWSEPLFKDGTFQVIRKLSQDVSALYEAVSSNVDDSAGLSEGELQKKQDELLARMMGRTKAGEPLVANPGLVERNDFTFKGDDDGARCPLFSHIRRANPRDHKSMDTLDPKALIPRILRRGMSYGPAWQEGSSDDVDRGLIFQAYNASLSEQFEVIQRWISGGNRTAPYSRLSDPFLGLPDNDEPRIYRFADGSSLNLGSKPFVRLLWGLYLFVPSRVGLGVIAGSQPSAGKDWAEEGMETIERLRVLESQDWKDAFDAWKRLLEEKESLDDEQHRGVWQAVRERHNGVLRTPFGVLVGAADLVSHVLATPEDFSVAGYDERLSRCVGRNYLGMDPPEHDLKADRVNKVFSLIKKKAAFEHALPLANKLLENLGKVGGQASIPMPKYADLVLAEVSKAWFGVPDGTTLLELLGRNPPDPHALIEAGGEALVGSDKPHCPYDVISSSRFVFQPHPTDPVNATATAQGEKLGRAMTYFVGKLPDDQNRWPPLLRDLYSELQVDGLEGDFSEVVLGALLGYMPTVQGNFLFTIRDWIRENDFWRVQNAYLNALDSGQTSWEAAKSQIGPWLERSMARRPIPAMIHRRATRHLKLGGVTIAEGEMVVVGLVSAAAENGFTDVSPAFGGDYYATPKPTHACPGRKLGMGTLLAMIAALFEQPGSLRRAPSSSALLFDPPA